MFSERTEKMVCIRLDGANDERHSLMHAAHQAYTCTSGQAHLKERATTTQTQSQKSYTARLRIHTCWRIYR